MIKKASTRFIISVFLVCISIVGILAVIGFFSNGKLFGAVLFLISVILGSGFICLVSKESNRIEIGLLLIIVLFLVFRLVYGITIDKKVLSDQLACLKAAMLSVNNDFSWTNAKYFVHYPYQIPFVLYEAAVLKVFGTIRALYVFNAIFSIMTCLLIYLIANKLTKRRIALTVTALYSILPSSIFMISRLYNNIISGVFFLIAILFFLYFSEAVFSKKLLFKDIAYVFLTGFFLGISNLFRPEGIVGLLAVTVWFIYAFITNCIKATWKYTVIKSLVCFGVFVLAYVLVNQSVNIAVELTISSYGIKNSCIYWTVVCGLTPDNFGAYSTKYAYILDVSQQEQFSEFKRILNDIFGSMSFGDVISFFAKKLYYFWGMLDTGVIKLNDDVIIPTALRLCVDSLNHFVYFILILLSAIGVRKKNLKPFAVFLMILFIGFFCVYIFKEIQKSYLYSSILLLPLLSVFGLENIIEKQPYKRIQRVKNKIIKQR